MSDINVDVEEQVKNAANKDAAPAQAPTLKNDAVDMGPAVVRPTDKNPDAAAKAKQNTSDPAKKKAKEASLPKDHKPGSSVKEEAKPEDEKSKDKEVKAEDDEKYPEPLKGFWKTTPKQVSKEQGPTEFSVYQSGD